MKVDFAKFEGSLPYASELYGIYQPLLGWLSRRRTLQLAPSVASLKRRLLDELQFITVPVYTLPRSDVPARRAGRRVSSRCRTGRRPRAGRT